MIGVYAFNGRTVLKVKTTSLCFLCMPTKWSKTTTRRMPQCKAPCTDTARRLYPHYKALVVILQAALYWWIAGRMACKRNPNIHSFLWYRWVGLGITPLAFLRNGTAKLVFATIWCKKYNIVCILFKKCVLLQFFISIGTRVRSLSLLG